MSKPITDIGVLTIRDDEFRAVLKIFPTTTASTEVGTVNIP